jgi:hypothetical protein
MSQYLLIEFDDDNQCAALIEKLKGKKTFRTVGLFQKPRKFCECPPMSDLQQSRETARGARFGWWVHRACSRARKAPQAPRNLLESIDAPAREQNLFLHLTPNYPLMVHHV